MSMIRVVIDAMGGDNAPEEIVKGAVAALADQPEVQILLTGRPEAVEPILAGLSYDKDRLTVVPASEVIETAEPPVAAIRTKKDSSMTVGLNLVKEGKADCFISSGSTGALLVGAQLLVGRIPGVRRPPLAPVLPTTNGPSLLIDCGANVDARPEHLVQFARMGAAYMEGVVGIKNPTVGLMNIGAEEDKGNALVKETMPLLKACEDINFIGSVEARDIPFGAADVVVCEAFAGNVALKMYEGTAKALLSQIKAALMSSVRGKLGGLLIKPSLKGLMKTFDAAEYGGAPMLGLNGLVVKTHGSAKAGEIRTAVSQCVRFREQHMDEKIKEMMAKK